MKSLFFLIFLLMHITASAQSITLNLAENKNSSFTQPIDPGKIEVIELANTIVSPRIGNKGVSYQLEIKKEHLEQQPLSIAGFSGTSSDANCKGLSDAYQKLLTEKEEKNIPDKIKSVNDEIKKAGDHCSGLVDSSKKLILQTRMIFSVQQPITVSKGDKITITISRTDDNSKWTFVFNCPAENHWTVYYGFTFIPDVLTRFPNYYSNQQDDGSYIISKMNGSNKNVFQNVSPTAMFTYRFYKNPGAIMKFGLTGGIFYNTQILGAMFGPSWVIGDNLTLNTGLSFIQKNKLKGQFKDGQKITTNLDFDQLHDKIWTYDMFISIGLNIPELFKKNKDADSEKKKSSN